MKALLLLMTILLASCGTTKYVKVDKVNYDRFKHEQKIRVGMTKLQVMETFGSPDRHGKQYAYGGESVYYLYYNKIFCDTTICKVVFKDDYVVGYYDFRMEFDPKFVSLTK